MPPTVRKAFIYLTRDERDLLVMTHPDHPEAGIQVPAGTVRESEEPEAAAHGELAEETGLTDFRIVGLLGELVHDMCPFGKNELHQRFFYHAVLTGVAPPRWRHAELDAGDQPIALEFFWWPLWKKTPDLIAGHGDMIHNLKKTIESAERSGGLER